MTIYTARRDYIEVIGRIWMPATVAAQTINLSVYDLGNIGELTRDNVESWLATHSGDFQGVDDFHASIGTWESPWASEESECTFSDCMYPSEEV